MRRVLQFFVSNFCFSHSGVHDVGVRCECVCGCEVFSSLLQSSFEISVQNVVDLAHLYYRRIHVHFDMYVKYK